jgi:hypothetical protein
MTRFALTIEFDGGPYIALAAPTPVSMRVGCARMSMSKKAYPPSA